MHNAHNSEVDNPLAELASQMKQLYVSDREYVGASLDSASNALSSGATWAYSSGGHTLDRMYTIAKVCLLPSLGLPCTLKCSTLL